EGQQGAAEPIPQQPQGVPMMPGHKKQADALEGEIAGHQAAIQQHKAELVKPQDTPGRKANAEDSQARIYVHAKDLAQKQIDLARIRQPYLDREAQRAKARSQLASQPAPATKDDLPTVEGVPDPWTGKGEKIPPPPGPVANPLDFPHQHTAENYIAAVKADREAKGLPVHVADIAKDHE